MRSVSYEAAKEITEKSLKFTTARDVENYVNSRLSGFYQDEFLS